MLPRLSREVIEGFSRFSFFAQTCIDRGKPGPPPFGGPISLHRFLILSRRSGQVALTFQDPAQDFMGHPKCGIHLECLVQLRDPFVVPACLS